jgi:hypothetical protein
MLQYSKKTQFMPVYGKMQKGARPWARITSLTRADFDRMADVLKQFIAGQSPPIAR